LTPKKFPTPQRWCHRVQLWAGLMIQLKSGVVVEAVCAKAEELGIAVATEGTVVMGVPVGTDNYIEGALAAHVGELLLDVAALDYFTLHGQWTLLRVCVNQRPVYLQRLLQLQHGGVAFSRFDKAVTAKVLDVMGVLLLRAGGTRACALQCSSAWTPCAASRCS
jgi:hypothetical protein